MTQISTLIPNAEPYFHRGGLVGCLCLHGFMASPAEVRWLAQNLAEAGHTVYAPRLPGHGTNYRDMARVQWRDWLAAVVDAYYVLKAQCEQVFVVGHSMGGILGLLLATQVPLDGLAVLATPIMHRRQKVRAARWLKYVLHYTDQTDRSALIKTIQIEQERRNEAIVGRIRYDRWSTHGVAELVGVTTAARDCLPQIQTPLMLVYSQSDPTVPIEDMRIIAESVSSSQIEQHMLTESGHILPQDMEREKVFARVTDFVQRGSNPTA